MPQLYADHYDKYGIFAWLEGPRRGPGASSKVENGTVFTFRQRFHGAKRAQRAVVRWPWHDY
jgi:hypothetical protein